MSKNPFVKAEKGQRKLRAALVGPAGSGKTYTSLAVASHIADGGKVAVVDTEHGSASLYADDFIFDVLQLAKYNPQDYIDAIRAAEKYGYEVVIIDSLSHAWQGDGGVLDLVSGFGDWKDVTPLHRKLIDTILAAGVHVIATMRSKTEYLIESDGNKIKSVEKVGTAPIQRQGTDYEFDVVGDMDIHHNLHVTKTRCKAIADSVFAKPGEEFAAILAEWLGFGGPPMPRALMEFEIRDVWEYAQKRDLDKDELLEVLGVERGADFSAVNPYHAALSRIDDYLAHVEAEQIAAELSADPGQPALLDVPADETPVGEQMA